MALLVTNKGRVLTYGQIYHKVWGEESLSNENNTMGFQVRHIREKLYESGSETPFTIRCVHEVVYCFDADQE